MNVGAHLENFLSESNVEGSSFLCLLAHKCLSGQPLSLAEGGVDVFKMYTLCRQQLMHTDSGPQC